MAKIVGIVIVDDEKKICRLIEYLIDWEALGVQLLGVAYHGISACQMIQEKKPDILLTDICMPGMDGLQLIETARKQNPFLKCIIISGYKDFAYAQQGIRFGVKDYLLKPINKEELIHTLDKIVKEIVEFKSNDREQIQREATIRSYSHEIKRMYLRSYIEQKLEMNLEDFSREVQKKNGVESTSEVFRCILIKPDLRYKSYTKEGYQLLLDKTKELIKQEFSMLDLTIILEVGREGIFVLLLKDILERNDILKISNRIRERIIGLRDLFSGINVTIIVGNRIKYSTDLCKEIYYARRAIYHRFFIGTNRIIELERGNTEHEKVGKLNGEIKKILEAQLDTLEIDSVKQCLEQVKELMISTEHLEGIDVKMGLMLLAEYYLDNFQKLDDSVEYQQWSERFEEIVEHCVTLEELFEWFLKEIVDLYERMIENIKNRDIRPILYAKQYIEENKNKKIKLEDIAKTVGFSYAYFSSLFKKETGQTLTDYIQNARIQDAKQLLIQKDKNVTEVAALVGYNDVKFFNKQFKKTVGISPNEYHKMFSER